MKTIIVISLIFSISCFGQDSDNLGKSFRIKQNYLTKSCDAVGLNLKNPSDPLLRDFIVIVEAMTDSGYVISVPDFKDTVEQNIYRNKFIITPQSSVNNNTKDEGKNDNEPNKNAKSNDNTPEQKIYFLIPFTDFEKVCVRPVSKSGFTLGIPTIPAKLRFGNGGKGSNPRYFRFDGNLNLGLSAGWKYSFGEDNQYAINTLIGFTISSVNVDSLTTKGNVNSITSVASFSPHTGVVFDLKSFQFGLYTGFDFLYGKPNNYWVYKNQPWLGIGIGYSLFKTEGKKETN